MPWTAVDAAPAGLARLIVPDEFGGCDGARGRAERQDSFDHELSSVAKTFAADVAVDVAQRPLEKFGGAGIMLENPARKYFRDVVSFLHSDGIQTVHREKIIDELRERS